MICNFLFLSFLSLFLVQGNGLDITQDLDELQQLTNNAEKNILNIVDKIKNVTTSYDEMAKERLECLNWTYISLRNSLNSTVVETVSKGLSSKKQFPAFQCISTAGSEYLNKMDATFSKVPEESTRIRNKGAANVDSFRLLIPGFYNFLKNLNGQINEEMEKCQNQYDVTKVFDETSAEIRNLNAVLEQMDSEITKLKFVFFEEFVNFIHSTEKSLRKSFNDGKLKVSACLRR